MKAATAALVLLAAPAGAMTLEECGAGVERVFSAMPRTEILLDRDQAVDPEGWCVFSRTGPVVPAEILRWRSVRTDVVKLTIGPIPLLDAQPLRGSAVLQHDPASAVLAIEAWAGWDAGDRVVLKTRLDVIGLPAVPAAQMRVGAARLDTARARTYRQWFPGRFDRGSCRTRTRRPRRRDRGVKGLARTADCQVRAGGVCADPGGLAGRRRRDAGLERRSAAAHGRPDPTVIIFRDPEVWSEAATGAGHVGDRCAMRADMTKGMVA